MNRSQYFSKAASYRHSDGHGWLCDRVHGGGDERGLQCDLPGQRWCQVLRVETEREGNAHFKSKRSLFLLFCTWATRGQTETLLSWKSRWVILLYLKQPHLPSTSSHNNQHQILLYSAVCVWENNNILSTWEISKWARIQAFAPYLSQT